MKNINKKHTKSLETLLFILAMGIIIRVPFLNRIAIISIPQLLLQGFIAILMLAAIIKKSKISSYNILLSIILLFYIASTALNRGDIMGVLLESLGIFSLSLLIEYGLKEKRDSFLRAAYIYFFCCVIINLATVVMFPNGLYETMNLQYTTSLNWFLGYKNLHILFLFQLIFWGVISDIVKKAKISKKTVVAIGLSIITSIMIESTTTLVGIIIAMLLLIINEVRKNTKLLRIYNFTVIYIIAFVSVIVLRLQEKYDDLIFSLTQKHSDFVGRTHIWDSVFKLIKERPLIGYGKEESMIREAKDMAWPAAHAHNGILELFYRVGIIGAILSLFLIGTAFKELNKHKNEKVTKAVIAMIISMFIMLLTEYYAPLYVIPLFTVSYNIRSLLNEKAVS